jgi:hypothetical protein
MAQDCEERDGAEKAGDQPCGSGRMCFWLYYPIESDIASGLFRLSCLCG